MVDNRADLESMALSDEDLGLLLAMGDDASELDGSQAPMGGSSRVMLVPPPKRATGSQRTHKKPKKTSTKKKNGKGSTASSGTVAVPARCGYRTGKCPNLQAVKRNGKLHKLCELHREKANMNQKKLDRKKRLQRSQFGRTHGFHSACAFSYGSLSSEEDSHSLDLEHDADCHVHSPRTIDERAVVASVFPLRLTDARVRPTSLHEAPLALSVEELAIFRNLMTFDGQQCAPWSRAGPATHYARAV